MYESSNVYLLDRIVVFIVHKIILMQSLVRILHRPTVIISEYKIRSNISSVTLIVIRHLSFGIKS